MRFEELKKTGRKAFIPYIVGGDPDLTSLPLVLETLVQSGADLIEIGSLFRPVGRRTGDQAASVRARQNGCTLDKLFSTLHR